MDDRIGGCSQAPVIVFRQPESRLGQVAPEDADARGEEVVEARKVHVQLQRAPQPHFSLVCVLRADQQAERIAVSFQEAGDDVRPDIAGGAGYEDGHVALAHGGAAEGAATSRAGPLPEGSGS